MSAGDHRCELLTDGDGNVIARARVSPDLDERGRAALVSVMRAATRVMAERDAADPEAAEERGRRQAAAIARVRERAARSLGEGR